MMLPVDFSVTPTLTSTLIGAALHRRGLDVHFVEVAQAIEAIA